MADSVPPASMSTVTQSSPPTTGSPTAPPSQGSGKILLTKIVFGLAILSILAVAVSLLINPQQRQITADNSLRQQQLTELQQALKDYAARNQGTYPTTMGEYWCEDCTYDDYLAKGKDKWIPELVDDGFMSALPKDPVRSTGSVCQPKADNSFAGYVYYSPAPPYNTDYKVFAQCTPPSYALNYGLDAPKAAYCSQRPPYDSSSLTANPFRDVALKPFVDPARYTYAYAIYSPGLACL